MSQNKGMNERGNVLVWVLIVGGIIAFFVFNSYSPNDSPVTKSSLFYSSEGEEDTISRDEAISDYWDEIKDYVDGTETIEACSSESGNCYDVDADISGGQVDEIYFPTGGYLYFSADIDESGYASDTDQNGNDWDFTIDMDSSLIEEAISDWADSNEYMIE